MVHKDHVALIRDVIDAGGVWADFGSGTGAFTLALRDAGGESIQIYSVDQDEGGLEEQKKRFSELFPQTTITYLHQSFTDSLELSLLDGIIMANSLHYIVDQEAFLKDLKKYLKPNGKLVLVEYNVDNGNQWVPYPVSFERFTVMAKQSGFSVPEMLGRIPSQFLREIYSAVAHTI